MGQDIHDNLSKDLLESIYIALTLNVVFDYMWVHVMQRNREGKGDKRRGQVCFRS